MSFAHELVSTDMKLYYYPPSPYSQKALIALHEKQVSFTPVVIEPRAPELVKLTPLGKVPLLVLDDGWRIPESSIIVEYIDTHFASGPRLIPEDRDVGRQTRFHDRIADLYITESITKLLFDPKKPAAERDPAGVAAAHARLDTVYAGLDQHLAKRTWVMGDAFTMADCSLLPPLSYSRTLHPFDRFPHLAAYAARGFERPSYARVLAEAAPWLAKLTGATAAA